MKFQKTLLIVVSSLVLLAMLLGSCSSPTPEAEVPAPEEVEQPAEEPAEAEEPSAAEPTSVEVWFHSGKGEERDVLDAQVKDFNAMQDEIFIDAVQLPEGSYNDQVNAAALANDLPCLLDFDGPYLYNYAWSGYLTTIDEYVSDELKADFLPSIISQGTYGGNLYSLGTFRLWPGNLGQ